jgi:tetratricopeptide (TPR) repeat protein
LESVDSEDAEVRWYLDSVLALAHCSVGNVEEAATHATRVLGDSRATYLDRRTASLALALSYARRGERVEMEQAFSDALAAVDATESRLSQALARLARAVAYEAIGDSQADAYHLEAGSLLADIGVEPDGWEDAFRVAAGDKFNPVGLHNAGGSPNKPSW